MLHIALLRLPLSHSVSQPASLPVGLQNMHHAWMHDYNKQPEPAAHTNIVIKTSSFEILKRSNFELLQEFYLLYFSY